MRSLFRLGARRPAAEPARIHPDAAIVARAFDREFYLSRNPDVAEAGVDPLDHFLEFGWREGRDPTAEFSVRAYLAAFPDVAELGVNAFVHYLTSGRPALPAEPPLGFRYAVVAGLVPVEARIAGVTARPEPPASESVLGAALAGAADGLRRVHVTFSHDDFTAHLGGLQLSIRREAARLAEQGRDHLHLHPAHPWPVVRDGGEPGLLGVVLNGRAVGLFEPQSVVRALAAAAGPQAGGRSFAIHSLLGHAADETADILAALGLSRGTFWLHDFASLCAGFHLLRNDVEDCAAPPPGSAACGICIYGPWRARHVDAHARLFARLELTVAAPAQATLDLWRRASPLPAARTVVLPHARLVPAGPAPVPAANAPFTLAYAGLATPHKGWPIFRALAARFARDPRYAFLHLGAGRDGASDIPFRQVVADAAHPDAMKQALTQAGADAVLVWPLCRETFSFVAYEAVAAGCAVVTGPDSGNVQAFVTEGDRGLVLADEAALAAALESGEILRLSRARRRPTLYDLDYSALSLDLAPEASA